MLKKLGVILILAILIRAYFIGNGLFYGETVKIVKGYKSSGEFYTELNLPFKDKTGIYKTYERNFNYFEILEKYDAQLMFLEKVGDVTSYYFYSKKLPFKEVIKNKKVNLQVAVTKENVTIGSPIIYGGY